MTEPETRPPDPAASPIYPPLFRELRAIAANYWWSWQPDGPELFRDISPGRWEASGHNPRRLLDDTPVSRLTELDTDPRYRERAGEILSRFKTAMSAPSPWAESLRPRIAPERPVAYFSAEYAIHESLPIYAGGLGVLAGDHLKSASDLGLPLVAIGLLYRQGYFLQDLDRSVWQRERYVDIDVPSLPIERVPGPDGAPLSVTVTIHHRTVHVSIWRVPVGRVSLYLLDTNRDDNEDHDRWITGHLYGGNRDTRIVQELTLGIGGVRALRAIGIRPAVFHMNEGHSAFLTLELLREELAAGTPLAEAKARVRSQCVFTTHTPITAGHDVFGVDLMDTHLAGYWTEVGISRDELLGLGRRRVDDSWEPFGMTPLAIRNARATNGVSRRHGEVCREMWRDLWPDRPHDVPIGHVTNGIHVPTWTAPLARALLARHLGAGWEERLDDPELAAKIDAIPDAELWQLRNQLRRHLIAGVRAHTHAARSRGGQDPQFVAAADALFDPDVLTIGFARRMATYKRLSLIVHDPRRILHLLTDRDRPLQFVLAGKAHPFDDEAKRTLQDLARLAQPIEHLGRVAYLENYDVALARLLVQGCDVWLNLPRRPLEASGTSGQKVVPNGGLNVSILDGWWFEGAQGDNGWAVGDHLDTDNPNAQDDADAEALYRVLEQEVVPLFYTRDANGIPTGWLARVRASMRSLLPLFNTHRMVKEYSERIYLAGQGG